MMSLSSLFKAKQTLFFIFILLAIFTYSIIITEYILASISIFAILISPFLSSSTKSNQSSLNEVMFEVLKNTSLGKLENRVTNIPNDNSKESEFAWCINDALDQIEAFMRDIQTSIEYSSNGKGYRRPYASGLHGVFHNVVLSLNETIPLISSGYDAQIKGKLSNQFSTCL